MSTESKTIEVCKCPHCKTGEGVLIENNVFACYCGATWIKWYAVEQKMKITNKIVGADITDVTDDTKETIVSAKTDYIPIKPDYTPSQKSTTISKTKN